MLLYHLQFERYFFHKIACETNVGLKQSRLSLVKGKGALNLMYVEAMGCYSPIVAWARHVKGGAQSSPFAALNIPWN